MAGAYFESKNKSAYMKAFAEIAQASGSKGMVAGQAADMAGTAGGASAQAVEFIHSSKTGALIKACAAAGAIMSGSGEAGCEMLAKYGGIVGLMYQIADDIIDATASEAEAGKRTGKDAEAEKITYPLVYGLAGAKEQLRSLCSEAVAAISPLGSPGNFLKETALYLLGSADRIEEPI
jgi:geranylgeranyl diphosphate synthase type II